MKKRAFTLIELLIIITIIAILVGVALPYYQDYIKQAKLAKAEHELDIIKEALIKHDTMEDMLQSLTNEATTLMYIFLHKAEILVDNRVQNKRKI